MSSNINGPGWAIKMGMTPESIIWVESVLEKEGLSTTGWQYALDGGGCGLCQYGIKIVKVGKDHLNQRGMWLHEIAHALTEGHNHDGLFADEFTRLIDDHATALNRDDLFDKLVEALRKAYKLIIGLEAWTHGSHVDRRKQLQDIVDLLTEIEAAEEVGK